MDALALIGDEGRGKLRKASGRSKHPLIRGLPNRKTDYGKPIVSMTEYIGYRGNTRGTETSKYPEEKKVNNDSLSSGERTGKSLNRSLRYSSGAL